MYPPFLISRIPTKAGIILITSTHRRTLASSLSILGAPGLLLSVVLSVVQFPLGLFLRQFVVESSR